jgi:hypothetical protein
MTSMEWLFSFGCKGNHEEVEELIIISVISGSVEQPINIMDETPIAKLMIEGVEVNVAHDAS